MNNFILLSILMIIFIVAGVSFLASILVFRNRIDKEIAVLEHKQQVRKKHWK